MGYLIMRVCSGHEIIVGPARTDDTKGKRLNVTRY